MMFSRWFSSATASSSEDMQDMFAMLASHQLRTPLATAKWFAELLATDDQHPLSDDQRSAMIELQLALRRMGVLLDEFMDASRIQDSLLTPRLEQVDCRQLIEDILSDLRISAQQQSVDLQTDFPDASSVIETDPLLLRIILQNIIDNAIIYSHQNEVVRIHIESDSSSLQIKVSDSGIGIPKSQQDNIFSKFFRGTNALKKNPRGSGLGLYMSQQIIKQLGGEISFESTEDDGSTFTVSSAKTQH